MTERGRGMLFAVGAYGFWGVAPIYFKWVSFARADEVLVHRVVWSFVLLLAIVAVRGLWRPLAGIFRSRAELGHLLLSGVLVAANWLIFIWALQNDRMIETSLGYYITPLVNVVLGFVFLGERLRGLALVALALACVGVANEVFNAGGLPWVSLSLALTFGAYGLVRKRAAVDSVLGLTVETVLLLPFMLAWFGWLLLTADPAFGRLGWQQDLGLLAASIVTTVPLVAFAAAALRLPLSVLGFFQYLSPSMVLLLAIFVYGEPMRPSQFATFGFIWAGLALFTVSELERWRRIDRLERS
jgi:chloramphenicol-sensitive protein RarD